MSIEQLKRKIGLFLIVSHFFILLLVVILYLVGGFLFEEMTTTIALIIPMFSIFTTAIIKNFIANRTVIEKKEQDVIEKVSGEYTFITYFVPTLFIIFLVSMILLKAFNISFASFEQFKIMLGVTETAFGAYVGLVLSSLFEIKEPKADQKVEQKP